MVDELFPIAEPTKYQKHHWWHGDRWTPEWIEWVKKKSSWNFRMMSEEWDRKTCPFVDGKCNKTDCVHFEEGFEYNQSNIHIEWYGENMFSKHKCKLWGKR